MILASYVMEISLCNYKIWLCRQTLDTENIGLYFRNIKMKEHHFIKELLRSLLCLLIVITICDIGIASTKKVSSAQRFSVQNKDKPSFQDPIEYVLEKLEQFDLVMIGEHHYTREQPTFIQDVIKRCYEKDVIDFLFLEFGEFQDQGKIEAFLKSSEYNPQLVIDALRNGCDFGWGYKEYFDIFKLIYDKNKNRREKEKIKIVLVDGPPSTISMQKALYECFDGSSLSEKDKWHKASWLREGIAGRDPVMAEVMAIYLFDGRRQKGIYYAGSDHIREDLRKKDYGLHLFSAGGILSLKYPGRVCSLAFHNKPQYWQNSNDFNFFEQLYKRHAKAFAIDTADLRISHFMLKSDISSQGIPLTEAFDGYIVLNLSEDYHDCSFVPGFYNDNFAKEIWEKVRKDIERLTEIPPELEKFKDRPWSGKELRELMKQGLH